MDNALPVREQHRKVAVENIAARARIARGTPADVWFPRAGNGGPVEPLFVFRQQAKARHNF
jgi:hypothetical protein